MQKRLCLILLTFALTRIAAAQQFDFPESAASDPATLSKAVPVLARQVISAYKEQDRDKYLENLFALQLAAGHYAEAGRSIVTLRELRRPAHPMRSAWENVQYEIYARAGAIQAAERKPFDQAYQQAFREVLGALDDRTSALVIREVTVVDESWMRPALEGDLAKQKGKSNIALPDALALVRDYEAVQAYHDPAPLLAALVAKDDARRYIVEKDIRVKTPDGATVCTLVERPRAASGRLPTLLKFTIYVNPGEVSNDVRLSAANGYAAVMGATRGKACSPDTPIEPYEYDGRDAAALIDWISTQPWSDGRVGMYGGSYDGFTPWAAAKYMPKGLKAIMVGAPVAPGSDVPMEGNVFWNFVYPWPFYTSYSKGLDETTYGSYKRWRKLDHDWYVSGRAYRDLEKIDGTPNPVFDRWISHPGYDAYWQSMIPYQQEFARVTIPVLTTAGYYYGGPGAAVYYFAQHQKYLPRAEHYLVIGPYHHIGAQFGVVGLLGNIFDSLAGLKLDEVAIRDFVELRYQWFDYILKGAPKPALLQDKVNYQVTGANVWKHAPTLASMAGSAMRLHLSGDRAGDAYRLTEKTSGKAVDLKVDLADRSDADRKVPGGGVVDKQVDARNGLEFVSDPLQKATELSGLFSGRLDFEPNKRDFDFEIDLYEQTQKGEYVQLTSYWTRASYVADRAHRQLLTSGKRQSLEFQSIRLMSRQLQPGSRIVAVLRVIKESGRQINYGTGKDVSDETVQDAKEPLEIRWYDDSYLDFPVGR